MVCGDFNETVPGGRGRCSTLTGGDVVVVPHKKGPGAVSMMSKMGLVDVYAKVNPGVSLDESFTRWGRISSGEMSISRIDYVFAGRKWLDRSGAISCSTASAGAGSDHSAVYASLRVRGQTSRTRRWTAPDEPKRGPCALGISEACKRAAARAIQREIALRQADWGRMLSGRLCQSPAQILDKVQKEVVDTIMAAVRPILPANGRRGKKYKSPPLREARSRIRAIVAVRNAIESGTAAAGGWRNQRWRRSVHGIHEMGIATDFAAGDAEQWYAWLEDARTLIRTERRRVRAAIRGMKDHPGQYLRTAFHRSKRRKRFFAEVFAKQSRDHLASAVDPESGSRTYDPVEYKPIIRKLVSKPFSNPHEPGPYKKDIWSDNVCTGKCGAPP